MRFLWSRWSKWRSERGRTVSSFPDENLANQVGPEHADARPFVTDQPWRSGDPDHLGRGAFARRIARTIADNPSDAGLVVGIYGPWGEGKTSLLHMVDKELKAGREIETLWFNPWYFQGQEALVLTYFGQLAAKLETRLGTSSDEFKRVLNKYGSVVSALPLSFYGVDLGKVMTAVGNRLKGSDLEALKQRLDTLLEEKKIDLVVFMDDIDRLDCTEIHAVLKLVKLVAGFRHVTYVLSFDDEMVAAAIGEAYGGDATAGRSFLEKIVQVPLRLPRVDEPTLLHLTLCEVDRAVSLARAEIPTDQVHEFRRFFDPLFTARPRTLRAGKRYGNALAFALPLLEGEVRVGDLLLLEALRAFIPETYSVISERRDLLLTRDSHDSFGDAQKRKDAALEAWNALLEQAAPQERRALAALLEHLFPCVQRFTRNMHYGSDSDARWATEQRIAAHDYFDRYFQYSVPPNDVSDVGIRELIVILATGNVDEATMRYDRLLKPGNAERLIRKLRRQEDTMLPVASASLVRVLIRRGNYLPRPPATFSFTLPHAQGIFLLASSLRRAPVHERFALAKEIVSEPTNLEFAVECFECIRSRSSDEEEKRVRIITAEEEARLSEILRQRISAVASVKPFYLDASERKQLLLYMWVSLAGREETEAVLKRRFDVDPTEAALLIAALASHPWDMTTGLPLPLEFDREQYNAVERLINPALVVEALQRAHGREVVRVSGNGGNDEAYEFPEGDVVSEVRLARRFTYLHKKITETTVSGASIATNGDASAVTIDVNSGGSAHDERAAEHEADDVSRKEHGL
jgi:hypothetical protein